MTKKTKTSTFILGLLTASILFTSCEFSKSASKDLITGAASSGDGINCDKVTIEASGKPTKNNQFVYGEKVNFIFDGLTGFTEMDGKKFPGLSLHIVNSEKDTVIGHTNLLDHIKDGLVTDSLALQLQANFTAALPYKNNEQYKVHIHIWDEKGKGNFTYKMPFTLEENDFLDVKTSGATYGNIYLWNKTKQEPVTEKNISSDHSFVLIIENADGFKPTENVVFPTLSLEIIDDNGNALLSEDNLFKKYEETGLNTDTFNEELYATIDFYGGTIYNPCRLKAVLKDQHSDKQIEITSELKIN